FFEMLGKFSFGDYFKDRAIELAWNLIVKEFGLSKDKLLVTVYAEDDDAARLWAKIAGLPEQKIIRIATSDNFWAMGDTGPCGPCSEIFYDHGEGIPGGPPGSPDQDGDRFIEIWNLVFMQYEQLPGGERVPLPRASVDTGMGLERIAAVLQGKHDNYDIDLFRALIPGTLRLEEDGFRQTLGRGLALLEEMAEGTGLKDSKTLDGSIAFTLYDTYGFPLDLTQDILRPRGIAVDVDQFDQEMEQARA